MKSSIEDSKALARAEQHSNQLDRDGSQEATPEMGSATPDHKLSASQSDGAGNGIPEKKAPKKAKNTPHAKAIRRYANTENGVGSVDGSGQ
jgi:hypothetical protein